MRGFGTEGLFDLVMIGSGPLCRIYKREWRDQNKSWENSYLIVYKNRERYPEKVDFFFGELLFGVLHMCLEPPLLTKKKKK